MDVYKALRELYIEKKYLDATIIALENRLNAVTRSNGATRSRRGRRSMSTQERAEVSSRMSRYWASRRAQKQSEAADARVHVDAQVPEIQMPPGPLDVQVHEATA